MKSIFDNEFFQKEYEKVNRYFNIEERVTPTPYFPEQNEMLTEKSVLKKIESAIDINRDLCIYIHIPFCDEKCNFCDLYCFSVPPDKRFIFEDYLETIEREIQLWGQLFDWKKRKVSTIHFGGGSPLVLTNEQLSKLLTTLKKYFNQSDKTEIAVEITTSQISPENIHFMKENNIFRIHVGIQTLNDSIRKIIGRRESSNAVRNKLSLLLEENFITSVDMLYGLPLQTIDIFKDELNELIKFGVDGFALYELQVPPKLNKIIENQNIENPEKINSYQMVLNGKSILNDNGYKNVFFNHYGNQRDKNLYFTFPQRNEDCIAFGAIADAQIGNIFFRHKKFKKYMDSVKDGNTGIDFGYIEDKKRAATKKFESYLMSTRIPNSAIHDMIEKYSFSFHGIFDMWTAAGLLKKSLKEDVYELTGSGCWLLSTMNMQIRRLN